MVYSKTLKSRGFPEHRSPRLSQPNRGAGGPTGRSLARHQCRPQAYRAYNPKSRCRCPRCLTLSPRPPPKPLRASLPLPPRALHHTRGQLIGTVDGHARRHRPTKTKRPPKSASHPNHHDLRVTLYYHNPRPSPRRRGPHRSSSKK